MRPAFILIIVLAATLFAGSGEQAAAVDNQLQLDLDPAAGGIQTTLTVSPTSGNFDVEVRVNNVTTTDCHPEYPGQECGLGGYTVEMTFDPTVVSYQSFADGPFLESTGRTSIFCPQPVTGRHDPENGVISISCTTQQGDTLGPTGSGHLATVTLAPVAVGTTDLELDNSVLTDISGDPLCHWNYTPCDTLGGTVNVNNMTDLQVTKAGPASVAAPTNFTYDVDVTNAGTDPATDVVVVDTLPDAFDFVSSNPGSPTCSESAGVVTCDLGTMAASQVENIDITVAAGAEDAGLTPVNVVDVTTSSYDENASNNHAEESTPVEPSVVSVTKTVPMDVGLSEENQYVIDLSSTGSSTAATVTMADPLPSNVTYLGVSTDWPGDPCDYDSPTHTVNCTLGDMAPSDEATVTIDVRFGTTSNDIVCNTATANWTPSGQNSTPPRCTFVDAPDTDGDGCRDIQELGDDPALGGDRDPNNPYDFFDVPAPPIDTAYPSPPGPGSTENLVVFGEDLSAILWYGGVSDPSPGVNDPVGAGDANSNGAVYDDDKNGNGTEDGLEYDLEGGDVAPAPPGTGPNGVVFGEELSSVLLQGGDDCSGAPPP